VAAFIRVAEDATVSDGQIRAHLASRLSPYKLPRHFVRVEEVPRTLTGKVRRGELIAEFAGAEGGGDWDDALELVRAEAAATVLGHSSPEAIDPETSFKDLGFDSLAGVELRNRLAEATGLRLASTLVFDHPSAEAVAKFLRAELEGARSAPADTDRKLDTIAGILASISVEERDRAAVRLKLLLADLAPATRLGGDEYDEVDFESASDEELLQLIDKELGRC
jgi:acyl carrier protein